MNNRNAKDEFEFKSITPSILYFGNPVAIVSSINHDGSPNLAPVSSFWALGWTVILGLLCDTQTFERFQCNKDCVVNVPSPDQWETVERLAPLTGKNPVPAESSARFRFEADKFDAAGLTSLVSESVEAPRVKECPVHLEAVVNSDSSARRGNRAWRNSAEGDGRGPGRQGVRTRRLHPRRELR